MMSLLFAIAKVGGTILANEKVFDEISTGVAKGIKKLNQLWDVDGDGDVDQDDLNILCEYGNMLVSIWGHAAMADGVTEGCEEQAVFELIEDIFFNADEPLFSTDLLHQLGIKKKDLKRSFWDKFKSPAPLHIIAKYAEEKELEENFFSQACSVIFCDKKVNVKEKQFLNELGQLLGLLDVEKKRILMEHVAIVKNSAALK